jgi:hypothetical protein
MEQMLFQSNFQVYHTNNSAVGNLADWNNEQSYGISIMVTQPANTARGQPLGCTLMLFLQVAAPTAYGLWPGALSADSLN